jgi:hypothetical protein
LKEARQEYPEADEADKVIADIKKEAGDKTDEPESEKKVEKKKKSASILDEWAPDMEELKKELNNDTNTNTNKEE